MELVSFIENIILHEDLMNPNLYHACVHTHLNTGNKIVLVTLCVMWIHSKDQFKSVTFKSCSWQLPSGSQNLQLLLG